MPIHNLKDATRRDFINTTIAGTAGVVVTGLANSPEAFAQDDRATIVAQIKAQRDATVQSLREWIALPSIAAENIGYPKGAEYMAQLAREAGFTHVELIPTKGKPGVFATLDVGAPTTLGLYFMYDVKQYDPAEWTQPPLEGRIIDRPGLGKVMIGRGALWTEEEIKAMADYLGTVYGGNAGRKQ